MIKWNKKTTTKKAFDWENMHTLYMMREYAYILYIVILE